MRVAITGANGFIGRHLSSYLSMLGCSVVHLTTKPAVSSDVYMPSLAHPSSNFCPLFVDVDVVVHAAGLAHSHSLFTNESIGTFHNVNAAGTLRLARHAWQSGVSRFIFLSTVKVHGDVTSSGKHITSRSPFRPVDVYSFSKMEAELMLREFSRSTSELEIVVIRPSLVYSDGLSEKAALQKLFGIARKGWPIPSCFGSHKRSYLWMGNLLRFIYESLTSSAVVGRSFVLSDPYPYSLVDLMSSVSDVYGTGRSSFPCSPSLLDAFLRLMGKRDLASRLLSSYIVDSLDDYVTVGLEPVSGLKMLNDHPSFCLF